MNKFEKLARLGITIQKFSKEELKHPTTRQSFDKLVENLYGAKEARKVIEQLEKSGIIPVTELSK